MSPARWCSSTDWTQCGWCDAVGFDNYLGGRLAAQYLLEGGHKRIGTTGDVAESSAADRRRGFVDAIEQAGERFDPALCVSRRIPFRRRLSCCRPDIDGGATAVFWLQRRDGARLPSAYGGTRAARHRRHAGDRLRQHSQTIRIGFAHDHRRTERGRWPPPAGACWAVESTPWCVAMAIPVRAVRGSPRRR